MNLGQVAILGLVQGISEWLPISSDGHLVLFEKWLAIGAADLSFDIFLHLASLFVLLIFFRRQIKDIIWDFFGRGISTERRYWGWYIVLSTAVTVLIGYWFYDYIAALRQPTVVAIFLLVSGLFVLLTKFFHGQKKINVPLALLLGLMQGLAVLPGLSRSALVVSTALLVGLNKRDAFEYGFILVIPAILGAFILSLRNFTFQPLWLAGFVVTAVVSLLTLRWLRALMNRDYFYLFSFYTFILGIIVLLA